MEIGNKKPDHFKDNYKCAELGICRSCWWDNGEQCIRQILHEGDIQEMIEQRDKK